MPLSANLPALAASQPALNGDGGALAHVSNWPSVQAVTIAQLPGSLGAKTTANSLSVNIASDQAVGVSINSALPTGVNTIGSVNVVGGNATAVKVDGSAATQPVSATALPLPSGASTSALQTAGNTTLTAINTTLGTPLQAGGSVSVSNFPSLQPVTDTSAATHAPLYYQVTATVAAQSLATLIGTAVPSWATMAYITPENGTLRYRADGTPPTTAVGQPIAWGQSWSVNGASALSVAQFILSSGSGTVSIEFRG